METNSNINKQNFFISEEEKNSLLEGSQNYKQQKNQSYMTMEINDDDNSQNLMSNQFISDSENLESEENESDSNLIDFKEINKEIIFEFYQAVKDNNTAFLEEFVKTESNIKCKFLKKL